MQLKPDQERVCTLLKETISLMCKNGLTFNSKFCIDAVIGVTLDEKDCFLINMNEVIQSDKPALADSDSGGEAYASNTKRKRKRNRHIKKEDRSGESSSEDDYDGLSSPAKRNNGNQDDDDDDTAIVFVKQEQKTPWSESSCQYDTQDNMGQSTSEMNFQGYAELSQHASDLSQSNSAFQSSSIQPRFMGHPSKSSYSTTSTTTGMGSVQDSSHSQMIKMFHCSVCGKAFADRHYLRDHENRHQGKFKLHCQLCQKGFMSSTGLKGHMANYHSCSKDYKCTVCGKAYSYKHHLKEHMLAKHPELHI